MSCQSRDFFGKQRCHFSRDRELLAHDPGRCVLTEGSQATVRVQTSGLKLHGVDLTEQSRLEKMCRHVPFEAAALFSFFHCVTFVLAQSYCRRKRTMEPPKRRQEQIQVVHSTVYQCSELRDSQRFCRLASVLTGMGGHQSDKTHKWLGLMLSRLAMSSHSFSSMISV
jgi:hypothetical protein